MHDTAIRFAVLAALLQLACSGSKRPADDAAPTNDADAPVVAGGESSEFSGGGVPGGYCPIEVSRTPLDFAREDVAAFLDLAVGHHELPLRWSKAFPDDAIRGFEENTNVVLDVTAIAVEDVVCSTGGAGGYEAEGLDGRTQRRFDFDIALSTADGAVQAAFPARFYPLRDACLPSEGSCVIVDRLLSGGAVALEFDDIGGSLELGVDPELVVASNTFSVQLDFSERGVRGTLSSNVTLSRPVLGGDTPRWSPVSGVFPPPDAGCERGMRVPLDEPLADLGDTPRAAYEAAFSEFPAPITAVWQDPQHPGELSWTQLTLTPSTPAHACTEGGGVRVHTSLRLETSDGLLRAEAPVIAGIGRLPVPGGQTMLAATDVRATRAWMPLEEFRLAAGIGDVDLGLAEYGTFALYQSFNVDGGQLQGEFNLAKWENYDALRIDDTSLRWCAGSECEHLWCALTATAESDCL
jgi:hypothetical protein